MFYNDNKGTYCKMEACSRLSPIVRRIKALQGYCELRAKGKHYLSLVKKLSFK